MRIHWSNKTLAQLADSTEGLQLHAALAADQLADKLIVASYRLANFPQLGPGCCQKVISRNLRELFVGKYQLVYTVGGFQVEIIAVLH